MASSSTSSALLQEREKFLKRQADAASFRANNEKRMKTEKTTQAKANRPKQNSSRSQATTDTKNDYPTTIAGRPRPQILQMIVDKLKERFLDGNSEPLTIEEIANEINVTFDTSDRHWLVSGPLLSNERIDVKNIDDVNKFVYKPPLELKGNKRLALLNLLKTRHEECEGAISVEDIRNSIPKSQSKKLDADKIIENLIKAGDVIKFAASNKREVLFYADRAHNLNVHQDFIKGWKSISVENKTPEEIREDLNREGHRGLMSNRTSLATNKESKTKKRPGRRTDRLKDNQHVADQLEDYSNVTIKK